MDIRNPILRRFYDEWWSRIRRDGDPPCRPSLTAEAFIAGWNAGVAKAATIAEQHPNLPEAGSYCLDAKGCCEVIAGEIGDLVERQP